MLQPQDIFKSQLAKLEHDHPTAMVLLLNLQGTYLYVNDNCRDVLGREPQEIVGHNALEFAAPADVVHGELTLRDALLNDESVVVHIQVKHGSGQLKPIEGAAQRLVDPATGTVYLSGWVKLV